MKLLIAFDGSECSSTAVAGLSHAGLPANAEAVVLSVADVLLPPGTDWQTLVAQTDLPAAVLVARERAVQATEAAQATALRGAALVRGLFPGWTVHARGASDSPAWGVLKEADAWHPDLIVVGTHGRGPVQRFFLGSVSQRVLAEARTSVLVVRARGEAEPGAPLKLVLAADGSEESLVAVRAIAGRTWPAGTRVQVVTVMDPRLQTAVVWPGGYAGQWVERRDADAREWIAHVAEKFTRDLEAAGLRAEMHLFDGDPREILLRQAEEYGADCVFLGAHGLQHGQRRALGSVASALAARAHCSVEVIRAAA